MILIYKYYPPNLVALSSSALSSSALGRATVLLAGALGVRGGRRGSCRGGGGGGAIGIGRVGGGRLHDLGLADDGRLDHGSDLGGGGELFGGAGVLVGGDGGRQVSLVELHLLLDGGLAGGGGDLRGDVGLDVGVGLLDGEAAAKGAGQGVVAAAHGADVASGAAGAVEGGGHGDGHVEVLSLGLGEAVGAGHVVGDRQWRLAGGAQAVARGVHVACVRAGAVGVDLVDGDGQGRAGLDLRDLSGGQGVLGVLAHVDVAADLGPPALVGYVGVDLGVADQRGVLLARADAGAVSCEVVDCFPFVSEPWEIWMRRTGAWRCFLFWCFVPWKPTLLGDPAMPTALRIWEWPWASEARAARDRSLMENMLTDEVGSKV